MNSAGTKFDIRQAVIEGTPENKELLEKLDVVAHELKKLQDAGVIVIWRPFHECSGGWFCGHARPRTLQETVANQVVDMIGLDVYPKTPEKHPTFSDDYKQMRAFAGGRKVVALTESGAIPDPDKLFADGGGWAYFLTWNEFASNPAQNTAAFLKSVYQHPQDHAGRISRNLRSEFAAEGRE